MTRILNSLLIKGNKFLVNKLLVHFFVFHPLAIGHCFLPAKVIEDFETRFNVPILEAYRMSESTCAVTPSKG